MRLSKISIRNILGIEHLDLKPGKLTRVTGPNGSGKTSVIEALKTVFEGGADAELVRKGAKHGEIVLVLDDPERGEFQVKKKIRASGTAELTVNSEKLGPLNKPKEFLATIADSLSANPVAILTATEKERIKILLATLPLKITAAEVTEAAGIAVDPTEIEGHAFDAITRIRARVFAARTDVNRTAKDKRASADQLAGTLPDVALDAATLEGERKALDTEKNLIRAELDRELQTMQARLTSELAEVENETAEAIEAIRAEAAKKISVLDAERFERKSYLQSSFEVSRAAKEKSVEPRRIEIDIRFAEIRDMSSRAASDSTQRHMVAKFTAEAADAEMKSESLTAALAGLDKLNEKLLAELPIKGLAVADGKITYEGIDFEHLNHAKRVQLAIRIAKLRAGDLGLICFDGFEALDDKTMAAFSKMAESQDEFQFVVTQVTPGDGLKVETGE